jgi:hypothetical protein
VHLPCVRDSVHVKAALERITGTILIAIGIRLALERR